jgi:archaellum component FlaC
MQSKESIGKGATSKKTLEDLEENEARVTDGSDDLPSPDGEFDDADQAKDADPV